MTTDKRENVLYIVGYNIKYYNCKQPCSELLISAQELKLYIICLVSGIFQVYKKIQMIFIFRVTEAH